MGLRENMLNEPVSKLAMREAITVDPDTTVRAAILKMRAKGLGCVIVVDTDNRPTGLFTEAILRELLAQTPDVMTDRVATHMSAQCPWVKSTDPIATVVDAMREKNIRFVCVVDDDGRVSALTGQKGLIEYIAEHFPGQVMVQRVGGTPNTTQREGA